MKLTLKRMIVITLCIAMTMSALVGCSKKPDGGNDNVNKENTDKGNTDQGNKDTNPIDSGAILPGVENDLSMVVEGEADTTKMLTTLIDVDSSPAFNGNPYDAAGINWSLYPFVYDYLAYYTPFPERTFKTSLLESYDFSNKVLTMKLLPGLKWSDGSVLDAEDLLTQLYCGVGRNTMWSYVDSIEKLDELTVRITYCTESQLILNVSLYQPIMTPNEVYGGFAEKYKDIAENSRSFDAATNKYIFTEEGTSKLAAANEEFLAYKPAPDEAIFSGQYVIGNHNSSEILFTVNEHYRKTPLITNIRGLRPGDSQAFATAILAGEYTVENGGLNVDMSAQIDKKYADTMRKIYIPEMSSIGYTINVNNYPLDIPEVRKAISLATDRSALITIAEPGSFMGDTKNSPLLPSLQGTYTHEGFMDTLTDYGYDPARAEEMLLSIGWTKENGKWLDDNGEAPVISIATINSWPSFMMTAEAMSTMLTDFGFNIDFKPMEFGVWNDFTKSDEKMISCVFLAGADSYAHPWETYSSLFTNVRAGWPKVEPGQDIIMLAPTSGKEYNVTEMLNQLFNTDDAEKTKELTEEFMVLANDLSAYIPVIEKAAPFRIYDPKLSMADAELNAVQKNYYYYGNINTILAKLIKDDLIYFVK
ncbi:peptide/nickel transport system substrate-binding protein [Anaerotaenia torta]|uniref:ABC transporter substrate-binding protein n=1 Tax=Anaerotaenia torta TaxID=433293 RepID=UPI003D1E0993